MASGFRDVHGFRWVQWQVVGCGFDESMEMLGITPPLPVPRPAYQGTSV
jgi:hypothetical protein